MMKSIPLALTAAFCALTALAAPLTPEPVYPEIARRVVRQLNTTHLSGERFGDHLSAVAWTNLVDALDFDRTLLTQEDLKRLEPLRTTLDDALAAGDLAFGYDLMALVRERLAQRCDYAEALLKDPATFDFSGDESYVWKRRKAERPADAAAQKQLWRSALRNEVLAITLAKELDAEEKAAKPEDDKPNYDTEDLSQPAEEVIRKRYRTLRDAYGEMDSETVLQRTLSAVANAYDPHTDYMSPMNFEDFSMEMNLTLCGIGATLRYDDGAVRITELMPGAPAASDTRDIRLQEGDRIIGVGQGDGPIEDIQHKPLNRTVRKIRGPKGTKVVLRVIPVSDKTGTRTKLVDLIRDEIKLEEQAVTGCVQRLENDRRLGYVRIPAFYAGAVSGDIGADARSMTKDLLRYIQQFNAEHVDGMVIDLRNNGGGSLLEALSMTGLFVTGPAVQVRDARSVQVLPAQGQVAFSKPLLVLTNRNSASASEIVASALQDYGRAIIVGDSKSHGKGTVQTVQGLGGDSTVYGADRITTACFYRINGGTTQLRGVIPDLVLPSLYDALELGEDQLPGALPYTTVNPAYYAKTADLAPFLPRLKAASDARLAKDEQYLAAQKLIDHVREANAEQVVTLNLEKRRTRMRAERQLQKAQDDLLSGAQRKKQGPTPENDPVLREALAILSDFIDLRGGPDEPVNTNGDLGSRLFRIFGVTR
ncbi:MAG: carboxy terminal-processing peptidase [Candidatus Spyradenecus sp.]